MSPVILFPVEGFFFSIFRKTHLKNLPSETLQRRGKRSNKL